MSIGIGGAGGKLASMFDVNKATLINVSQTELDKEEAANKILAVAHSSEGQFKGSGKNPLIGETAFSSIKDEILNIIKGDLVFASTGGGTGNGISSVLLKKLAEEEDILLNDSTMFAFILPYLKEAGEYVENTISFLMDALSKGIDSGNTGNIMLFSNKVKIERRLSEDEYNRLIINSILEFFSIPKKGEMYKPLDGHIDYEDFKVFKSKPYFNHFFTFNYTPDKPLQDILNENYNELLLMPEKPIEAMFLMEVPNVEQTNYFYNIMDYFADEDVIPIYSVVHNPDIFEPRVTMSLLYSRKPKELVEDFRSMADKLTRKKLKKSIEQFVKLEGKNLDIKEEVRKITNSENEQDHQDNNGEEVLEVLKRLKRFK